jgi:hypothetical protein
MINESYYLDKFYKAAEKLHQNTFQQQHLDVKVGVWLDSVVLKVQNSMWINQAPHAKPFEEGVFFSVWVNDNTIHKGRIYYNIHAIKMRKLKGYNIESRKFAGAFRAKFEPLKAQWPNVSTAAGPLTLMEGWIALDDDQIVGEISRLTHNFIPLAQIIDGLLNEIKK